VADFATGIIVAHNHPSGDPNPSKQDITTTQQLVAAGQILGVKLYDHVIVAGSEH
jgi:DNA repair protein RadC